MKIINTMVVSNGRTLRGLRPQPLPDVYAGLFPTQSGHGSSSTKSLNAKELYPEIKTFCPNITTSPSIFEKNVA